MRFHKRVHKELSALLNGRIIDDHGNIIGRWIYADGNVALQFKSSSGGSGALIEQWNPAPPKSYVSGNMVTFTPDGEPTATFYVPFNSDRSSQTVPNGTQPDTGAPYWSKLPNGGTGVWL